MAGDNEDRIKAMQHDLAELRVAKEKIAHCKRDLGIDVLIPVRKDMDIYQDVLGLLKLPAPGRRQIPRPINNLTVCVMCWSKQL